MAIFYSDELLGEILGEPALRGNDVFYLAGFGPAELGASEDSVGEALYLGCYALRQCYYVTFNHADHLRLASIGVENVCGSLASLFTW